jgi:hypothetical protein
MSKAGEVAVFERSKELGFPAVAGIEPGEAGWLLGLPRADLGVVSRALAEHEERAALDREEERRRENLRHIEAVERGEESYTAEEEAELGQQKIEAEVAFQDFERKRPERVEALLERIANALESRAR